MKKIALLSLIASTSFSLMSCSTGPDAMTGTAVGALGGAAVGGIVGHQSGRGLEGAAIGALAGGAAGNVIGGAQDQRKAQRYYNGQPYYAPAPPPPRPYYY